MAKGAGKGGGHGTGTASVGTGHGTGSGHAVAQIGRSKPRSRLGHNLVASRLPPRIFTNTVPKVPSYKPPKKRI